MQNPNCKSCSPAHICNVANEYDNGVCTTQLCGYCNLKLVDRIIIKIRHCTTLFDSLFKRKDKI